MITLLRRRLEREGGFTLSEMLVAMIFLAVLFGAFATTMGSSIRDAGEVQGQSDLQVQARTAVDTLAADLRQAYTGDSTIPSVESIGVSSMSFISPDRAQPFHVRRIAYRLNGTTLERAMTTSTDTDGPPWVLSWTTPPSTAWQPQLTQVKNTTLFTYQDTNGATTSTASAVRYVTISVTVATNTEPTRQYTYGTSVAVRASA